MSTRTRKATAPAPSARLADALRNDLGYAPDYLLARIVGEIVDPEQLQAIWSAWTTAARDYSAQDAIAVEDQLLTSAERRGITLEDTPAEIPAPAAPRRRRSAAPVAIEVTVTKATPEETAAIIAEETAKATRTRKATGTGRKATRKATAPRKATRKA